MKTHLPQTKRIISALRSAGLKRSDFSVRTPRNHKGEYGTTRIVVYMTSAKLAAYIPAILKSCEIDIRQYEAGGQILGHSLFPGSGKIGVTEL